MARLLLAITVGLVLLLTACGDNSTSSPDSSGRLPTFTPTVIVRVTQPPPPPGLPTTVHPIEETALLGRIIRLADQEPQTFMLRKLLDAFCQDGVMIIQTTRETIYAAIPCDRFWDDDAKRAFLNEQVAIVLEVTLERFRVLIETLDGAQAEFTVDGLWLNQ